VEQVGKRNLQGGTDERIRASVLAVAISPSRSTRSIVPTGKNGRMILILIGKYQSMKKPTSNEKLPVRSILGKRAENAHLLKYGGSDVEAS
jgi:hypothetical protein